MQLPDLVQQNVGGVPTLAWGSALFVRGRARSTPSCCDRRSFVKTVLLPPGVDLFKAYSTASDSSSKELVSGVLLSDTSYVPLSPALGSSVNVLVSLLGVPPHFWDSAEEGKKFMQQNGHAC